MSPKKLRKDRIKLIIASLLMIALVAAGVIAAMNSTLRFILKDALSRIGNEKIELLQENPSIVLVTPGELKNDPRVTFNESMLLINADHLLDAEAELDIVEYKDSGVLMNSCVTSAYENISNAVKEKLSEKLYISSSYRTAEEQLREIEEEGDKAQKVGASEHQAGLSLDVYALYYGGYGFLKCEAGQWVNENCGDYGFIIRYPSFGKSSTGIAYEPWHLRYVGLPHSEIISKNAVTFEEYIDSLEVGKFYGATVKNVDWIISRQPKGEIKIPEDFTSCTVSPDNCGNYVLTIIS